MRKVAYGTLAFGVAVVLMPVFRPGQTDSFPHSTYPMFSEPLGRASALPTAVGVDDGGAVERLSPQLISGGYEPVRAFAVVAASISRGDTQVLCAEVAERVGKSSRRSITSIEVVTETHDVVAWFSGMRTPLERAVHARCPVVPGGP